MNTAIYKLTRSSPARLGAVQGGAAFGAEPPADHHFDEPSQASNALEQFLNPNPPKEGVGLAS